MLAFAAALLFSVSLPAGSEVYPSDQSVYAERSGVDMTLSVFPDALAEQAIAEFEGLLGREDPARPGAMVTHIGRDTLAGYPAVTVDYSKPAAQAVLNDAGDVEIRPATEVTRQVYIDVGAVRVVLTTWSKSDADGVARASDALVASVAGGPAAGSESGAVELRIGGADVGTLAGTYDSAPEPAPLEVEVLSSP